MPLPPTTGKGKTGDKKTTFNYEFPHLKMDNTGVNSKFYPENGIFEKNFLSKTYETLSTEGWVTYKDSLVDDNPIDGVGGTSDLTISNTLVDPITNQSSLVLSKPSGIDCHGQGISFDFKIDNFCIWKKMKLSFKFKKTSGYFLFSKEPIPKSSMTVWVYDVDYGTLLSLDNNNFLFQTAPPTYGEEFSVLFTAGSGSNLRIIIHVNTNDMGDFTMKFTDFKCQQYNTNGFLFAGTSFGTYITPDTDVAITNWSSTYNSSCCYSDFSGEKFYVYEGGTYLISATVSADMASSFNYGDVVTLKYQTYSYDIPSYNAYEKQFTSSWSGMVSFIGSSYAVRLNSHDWIRIAVASTVSFNTISSYAMGKQYCNLSILKIR